jgi:hypothetical protein
MSLVFLWASELFLERIWTAGLTRTAAPELEFNVAFGLAEHTGIEVRTVTGAASHGGRCWYKKLAEFAGVAVSNPVGACMSEDHSSGDIAALNGRLFLWIGSPC